MAQSCGHSVPLLLYILGSRPFRDDDDGYARAVSLSEEMTAGAEDYAESGERGRLDISSACLYAKTAHDDCASIGFCRSHISAFGAALAVSF